MIDHAIRPRWGWRYLPARQRLTIAIACIPVATAVLMGGAVYLFMRFVPSYDLPGSSSFHSETTDGGTATTGDPGNSINSTIGPENMPTPIVGPLNITSVVTIRGETDVLSAVLWISIICAVVLGIAGLIIGRILSRRVLRPLQHFNDAARRAADGGLDHRVALSGPQDEFTDLSETFDRMLERLDRTFQSHQRFAADASHELRTPLSAMKTMLEIADRDPDTDFRALLRRLQATNQRSIDTVEALLDLADLDHTDIHLAPVQLDEIVADVLASSATEIARSRLTVDTEIGEAKMDANTVLLRQLVTNLLQNAIRHNHPGGTISLVVGYENGFTRLSMSNSGDQLDPSAVTTFTTPFHRGTGRVSTKSGSPRSSGLGLAVAAAIVAAHHGNLLLTANTGPGGGLTVMVLFQS